MFSSATVWLIIIPPLSTPAFLALPLHPAPLHCDPDALFPLSLMRYFRFLLPSQGHLKQITACGTPDACACICAQQPVCTAEQR